VEERGNTRPEAPLGSEEDLRWRLSSLQPTDAVGGLLFNSVLGVVRRLGSEATVKHCLEASGETRFLDFFRYPTRAFLQLLYAAARSLSEKFGGFEQALWWLGYEVTAGFLSSTMGKALLMLMGGGPRRLLEAVPTSYRMITSHVKCTVSMEGSKSAILRFEHDVMPHPYMEGGFVALLDAAKVKDGKVCLRQPGPSRSEYELSWS
jgi:uncharacterized protein (TIGR02265 family)